MSSLMKNPNAMKNDGYIECQEIRSLEWTHGKEEDVWTNRVNPGCFVIVVITKMHCLMHHAGQLPPNGHDLYHSVPKANMELKWLEQVAGTALAQFRAYQDLFKEGQLFVVAPCYENASGRLDVTASIKQFSESLKKETGIAVEVVTYVPRTFEQHIKEQPDYCVVEVHSLGNGEMPKFYLNAAWKPYNQ